MSLFINNGRVLLENPAGSWYYLDVELVDGVPFIRVNQNAAGSPGDYSAYAVIRGSDGGYYKLYTATTAGNVHYAIETLATPEPAVRLFLKGSDEAYYEILMTSANGQVYMEIVPVNTLATTTIDSPWRLLSLSLEDLTKRRSLVPAAEDLTKRRNITPANFRSARTIVVPA